MNQRSQNFPNGTLYAKGTQPYLAPRVVKDRASLNDTLGHMIHGSEIEKLAHFRDNSG